MTENEILGHIDKHRYFSFTKDDSPDTKKSLDNLRIIGLIEPHGSNSVRLTQTGLQAVKIGYNNWVDKNMNFRDHELHEKILLFLFEFRDDDNFHDLLEKFPIKQSIIREKVEQLAKKNLVKPELSLRVLLGGEHVPERREVYRAKILIDGIEYVKRNLLTTEAFDDKKQNITISGGVGLFQNVTAANTGTISQLSDSSKKKATNEQKQNSKKPINIKAIVKNILWVLSALLTV